LLQKKSEPSPYSSHKEKAACQISLTMAAFILLFVSERSIPISFISNRYLNPKRLQ
jgi:hypothetical protein